MPSFQTRSFFLILLITVATTYAALIVVKEYNNSNTDTLEDKRTTSNNQVPLNIAKAEKPREIVIDTWSEFKDPESNLTFKHPSDWETTTISYTTNNQNYRISVGPKEAEDPITIYVSKKEYFAMEGLNFKKTKMNGNMGINMDDLIAGIKNSGKYFTFYSGQTWDYVPEFKALLGTINFK